MNLYNSESYFVCAVSLTHLIWHDINTLSVAVYTENH